MSSTSFTLRKTVLAAAVGLATGIRINTKSATIDVIFCQAKIDAMNPEQQKLIARVAKRQEQINALQKYDECKEKASLYSEELLQMSLGCFGLDDPEEKKKCAKVFWDSKCSMPNFREDKFSAQAVEYHISKLNGIFAPFYDRDSQDLCVQTMQKNDEIETRAYGIDCDSPRTDCEDQFCNDLEGPAQAFLKKLHGFQDELAFHRKLFVDGDHDEKCEELILNAEDDLIDSTVRHYATIESKCTDLPQPAVVQCARSVDVPKKDGSLESGPWNMYFKRNNMQCNAETFYDLKMDILEEIRDEYDEKIQACFERHGKSKSAYQSSKDSVTEGSSTEVKPLSNKEEKSKAFFQKFMEHTQYTKNGAFFVQQFSDIMARTYPFEDVKNLLGRHIESWGKHFPHGHSLHILKKWSHILEPKSSSNIWKGYKNRIHKLVNQLGKIKATIAYSLIGVWMNKLKRDATAELKLKQSGQQLQPGSLDRYNAYNKFCKMYFSEFLLSKQKFLQSHNFNENDILSFILATNSLDIDFTAIPEISVDFKQYTPDATLESFDRLEGFEQHQKIHETGFVMRLTQGTYKQSIAKIDASHIKSYWNGHGAFSKEFKNANGGGITGKIATAVHVLNERKTDLGIWALPYEEGKWQSNAMASEILNVQSAVIKNGDRDYTHYFPSWELMASVVLDTMALPKAIDNIPGFDAGKCDVCERVSRDHKPLSDIAKEVPKTSPTKAKKQGFFSRKFVSDKVKALFSQLGMDIKDEMKSTAKEMGTEQAIVYFENGGKAEGPVHEIVGLLSAVGEAIAGAL